MAPVTYCRARPPDTLWPLMRSEKPPAATPAPNVPVKVNGPMDGTSPVARKVLSLATKPLNPTLPVGQTKEIAPVVLVVRVALVGTEIVPVVSPPWLLTVRSAFCPADSANTALSVRAVATALDAPPQPPPKMARASEKMARPKKFFIGDFGEWEERKGCGVVSDH